MTDLATLSDAELEAISGNDMVGFTKAAAARIGVRPELALKVRHQESRGNPSAVSPKGARGPFQLMPKTAAELGVDPDDEIDNTLGGLTYLKQQIDDFGDERLGLAAYNAGPGAVREHGGVPPFAETQNYVDSIMGGEDQPAEPPADLAEVPDDELERIAAGEDTTAPAEAATDPAENIPRLHAPKSAMDQRSKFVFSDTDEPLNPAQKTTYEAMIKDGSIDPAKVRAGEGIGSRGNPKVQRDPLDEPKPGDWYITVDGTLRQTAPDPWLNTAGAAIADAASGYRGLPEQDPRYAAMKRAVQSGGLLGGRNELVAGMESIPRVLDGFPALKKTFGDTLAAEDVKSGKARRNFPIAYDASAVAGALPTAALVPEGLVPRLALGGSAGFLSTDGGLGERALGAGLGMAGGEALNFAVPRLAGAAMDMAGIPQRAAGATRAELKAAEAAARAVGRDAGFSGIPMAEGAMPLHASGDNVGALAEVLAQSPGPGQTIIRQAVRDQQAGAPGRVKGAVAEAFGGDNTYFEKLRGLKEERATDAASGMEKLAGHEVTLDENSVSALRSDLARSAIKEQVLNSLASTDPEVRAAGARLNRLHDDLLDKPGSQTITVRDAQNISKSLLDAAKTAFRTDGARGKALSELGKSIRENAATPDRGGFSEYGDWLKKYGEDSSGIDALEMGRKVFGSQLDMSAENLRRTFSGWSDEAKEQYRQGVGEALLAAVRGKGGVTEARQLLKNEEFADRLRVAVPDDMSFSGFMDAMEREVAMADRNNRVVGGSPTYARQAARADLEGQGRDPLDTAAEFIDTTINPVKLTAKGLKVALKAIPRKDQSLIADPAANAALAKALTDQAEMDRLLAMLKTYREKRAIPMRQVPARIGSQAGALVAEPRN